MKNSIEFKRELKLILEHIVDDFQDIHYYSMDSNEFDHRDKRLLTISYCKYRDYLYDYLYELKADIDSIEKSQKPYIPVFHNWTDVE